VKPKMNKKEAKHYQFYIIADCHFIDAS